MLLAFLLSLPFLADFLTDDPLVADIYTAALLCSAGAAVVFIAHVAIHRLHFRQGLKEQLLWLTHSMSLVGLVLLLAAMALAMWIVVGAPWSRGWASAIVVGVVATAVTAWVVVPRLALHRQQSDSREDER